MRTLLMVVVMLSSSNRCLGQPDYDDVLRGASYEHMGGVAKDISNWDSLSDFYDIVRIRFVGFRRPDGKLIDVTVTDPKILRRFENALQRERLLRPAYSEIGEATGAYGGGSHKGVLLVDTEAGPRVIGVNAGFHLGVWYGSHRQVFFSWALTRLVDDVQFEHTGKRFSDGDYALMSGLSILNASKAAVGESKALDEK